MATKKQLKSLNGRFAVYSVFESNTEREEFTKRAMCALEKYGVVCDCVIRNIVHYDNGTIFKIPADHAGLINFTFTAMIINSIRIPYRDITIVDDDTLKTKSGATIKITNCMKTIAQ